MLYRPTLLSILVFGFVLVPIANVKAADLISQKDLSTITTAYSFDIPVGLNFPGPTNPAGGVLGWFEAYLNINDTSRTAYFKLYDASTPLDCQTPTVNLAATYGIPEGNGDPVSEFTTLVVVSGFTGTQCAIPSSISNYSIRVVNVSGSGSLAIGGTGGYPAWRAYTGSPAPADTTTRIDSVSPADGETIATSTPVTSGATGYINEEDYREGMRLRIKVDRLTDQQAVGSLLAFESAFGNFTTYEINASGEFDVGTTTQYDRLGKYTVYTVVERPSFSFLGAHFFQSALVATTTSFIVGARTGVDIIVDTGTETLEDLIATQSDPLENCQFDFSSILDFSSESNLFSCIGGITSALMVPNAKQSQELVEQARQTFLYKAPWGYATLVFDAFTASSTEESLPQLSIEFPVGPLQGQTLDLTPWNNLAGDGSYMGDYVSPYTGNAFLPALLNIWNTVWLAVFAFWLLSLFKRHSESGNSNIH